MVTTDQPMTRTRRRLVRENLERYLTLAEKHWREPDGDYSLKQADQELGVLKAIQATAARAKRHEARLQGLRA